MCLIARHFESRGLPTLILGSGLDIMRAGQPPRAVFVNYPLGFEAGRFRDRENQLAVVRAALEGFERMTSPDILLLDHEWQAGWDLVDEREKGKLDLRSPRDGSPRYQTEADRLAVEQP